MDIGFGIDRKSFFEDINEKTFLLKKSAVDTSSFGWSNIDQALFCWDVDVGDIKIYKNGVIEHSEFLESYSDYGDLKLRIKKNAFYRHLMDGSSISFRKFHSKDVFSNKLAMEVSRFTRANTFVNAYAAIGGEGTFQKHYDRHDVFAIQLIGKKRWKLYKPSFEKPLPQHKSKPLLPGSPNEPILDVILEEGDLLYIPRGMWHEAIPLDNQESFHLAIGTYPLKMVDFCEWIIKNKLHENLLGREYIFSDSDANSMNDLASYFSGLLTNNEVLKEFMEECNNDLRFRSEFNLEGLLSGDIYKGCNEKKLKLNSINKIDNNGKIVVNGIEFELENKAVNYLNSCSSVVRNNNESNKEVSDDYIKNFVTKMNFMDIMS